MRQRQFILKIILTTAVIGLSSCFLTGDIKRADGLDFLAEKLFSSHYSACTANEICQGDGQGASSFLKMVMERESVFGSAWELEEEEAMALALEENKGEQLTEELAEQSVEPATATIGDVSPGEAAEASIASRTETKKENAIVNQLKKTMDAGYLLENFYIVDSTTSISKDLFPVKKLIEKNHMLEKKSGKKQILIYHTHGASESYQKGNGKIKNSIVDVGEALAQELETQYGYGVYHDKTKYDYIRGSIDRSAGYNVALKGIETILKKNKDIQVVIDLHRDGVAKSESDTVTIDGRKTARIMFFNGLSRSKSGPIAYLNNPNLQGNLSFSLQSKMAAMQNYPEFAKPIYLKGYRYNLHVKERCLLIELGNQNNTAEEAMNAVVPLAKVLDEVLEGKKRS